MIIPCEVLWQTDFVLMVKAQRCPPTDQEHDNQDEEDDTDMVLVTPQYKANIVKIVIVGCRNSFGVFYFMELH